MKKALSTVIIFIAVLQIGGITPFYFYFLQLIKDEIKIELAAAKNLEPVLISEGDYNNPAVFQITDGHEFRYRGRMYDFQSVKKTRDAYVFYALADNKEYNLEKVFGNDFQQNTSKSNTAKNQGSKTVKDFYNYYTAFTASAFSAALLHVQLLGSARFTCLLSEGHCLIIQSPPDFS